MRTKFIPHNLYKKIINLIPICCMDLVVKKGDSFLLIKRLENPAKNKWWFPGGRILFNETLDQAVKRKLKEELNIRNFRIVKFLGVKEIGFKKGKYNQPIYNIANVFLVELPEKEEPIVKMDKTMSEYKWFNVVQNNFDPYIKEFLNLSGF